MERHHETAVAVARDAGETARTPDGSRTGRNPTPAPAADSPVALMVSDSLVNVRDNWASRQRAMYDVAEWGVSES